MRQLFLGLATAAALLASQNSAQAVFEKVIIDDGSNPASPTHNSAPGGSSHGTMMDPVSGVVTTRTLVGRAPTPSPPAPFPLPAAIVAGGGNFNLALAAGESAMMSYTGFSDPALLTDNPVVFLTSLISTGLTPPGASLLITATYNGGTLFGSPVVYVAGAGMQDIQFAEVGAAAVTDLTFTFTADPLLTGQGFSGSFDNVVANPEPATMALMGLGVLGGAIGYRRRRKEEQVAPHEEAAPVGA